MWGVTGDEVARPYPCDGVFPGPTVAWFRGVDVDAEPAAVFRWLCQLRVAPYSYDFVDNLGRRSPQRLVPGLERLAVGQTMMTIFELASFAQDEHLTVRMRPGPGRRAFGDLLVTYAIRPAGPGRSRLVAKLVLPTGQHRSYRLMRPLLAWGDLVMMRRQLHNLARLAARHGSLT
ncbi:hypothetical protein ACFFX1_53640 [Dactylosporangium sucinum]|uniref:Uncharacterized protein n=1 Tax=Dactylosporangium sucinum TaxID=1424081 RepID=A0A917X450_9ACTN|nr:hypothetical protein [Dactylosporangium sucinum]GGM61779.1 hypothetical protein GCM10007977_074060 [Dactylosporangium sucinum]